MMNSDKDITKPMGKKESHHFSQIAETIFAPIYPVIARQMLLNTGLQSGKALEIGCGPGHLATALAETSDFKIYTLDCSQDMIDICKRRIREKNLQTRIVPTLGDVSKIPFEDGTFDLIMSRGSWFFWDDLAKGLQEIYRVLKPGGKTYIGGGFGSSELKNEIVSAMKKQEMDFEQVMKGRFASRAPEVVSPLLKQAGITDYSYINDDSGFWLVMVHP